MPPIFTARSGGDVDERMDEVPGEWSRAEFSRRVQPHLPKLYRLCLTLSRGESEAEDLLQNSLVKAYIHRAAFEGRGAFLSWLYGIVRHEHLEMGRTIERRRTLLQSALERAGDLLDGLTGGASCSDAHDPDPERSMILHEEAELMLRCLRAIREPYRTVVHLCDVEELSYEEVAEIVDAPVGTVKSRHARGRALLREVFAGACPEEER